jgi:hypothetical protein
MTVEKKIGSTDLQQEMHDSSTVFPQICPACDGPARPRARGRNAGTRKRAEPSVLDVAGDDTYAWNSMKRRWLTSAMFVCSFAVCEASAAEEGAAEFRVFLKDGTSLVSFGELARVEDRVVFSMPTSASETSPQLQLVNLSAEHVDWDRTARYADSVRSARYLATQAEARYSMLTAEIAQAINDVQTTGDPARRLEIVERARRMLAEWPARHFNYKQAEIEHMVGLLDEAIADLRAAAGLQRFDLSFVASTDEVRPGREPLLPRPTVREAIEQTLIAARLADVSADRVSLMVVALSNLDRHADVLPSGWRTEVAKTTRAAIAMEVEADTAYQALTSRTLERAAARARAADVRGIERLILEVRERDHVLGNKRPEAVNALIESVQAELDVARQLRLARDRWAMRVEELRKYHASVGTPLERLESLTPALEDIKALAGSSPWALGTIQRVAGQVLKTVSGIEPPEEFQSAHALLVSAAQMADSAAKIRREAALHGSMPRAWDASAAAAGSMMLGARARKEMQEMLRLPQLQR